MPKVSEKKPLRQLRIQFSGEAGDGILTAGDCLMQAAARSGYQATVYKSFPPNIRGGYSMSLVTICSGPVLSPVGRFDVLVALNRFSFEINKEQLVRGMILIAETEVFDSPNGSLELRALIRKGIIVYCTPAARLAREAAGAGQTRSIAALGTVAYLMRMPRDLLDELIRERFSRKGPEIAELNRSVLEASFAWAASNLNDASIAVYLRFKKKPRHLPRVILEGNEAIGLGALAAGCTFFASYPITPATSIGDLLAEHIKENGGFAYQAEDEMAALGAVVGASFSGARSMTATSGPGLSLMQEFLGYASMVELPLVVVDVQRAGPSTGMPTKHGQDDLLAAAFGGHGEGQRIVIAPTDVEDCLSLTIEAFNLAERYQCPVILLSDSSLGMIRAVVDKPDLDKITVVARKILGSGKRPFQRYKVTSDGTNFIPVPGVSPVSYRVTGVEHDEDSAPSFSPSVRMQQMEKRFSKVRTIEQEQQQLLEWDLRDVAHGKVDCALAAWGLTASVARETILRMRARGYRIAALYPRLLFPVCTSAIERLAALAKHFIIPEANFTGQYAHLVRMYAQVSPESIAVSHGEPLMPEELEKRIIQIVGGPHKQDRE